MRSTLPFCQGPWGLACLRSMPATSSQPLNSRERYPGPSSVITRSTSTPGGREP